MKILMTTGHRDYQRQLRNDNNNINEQLLSNCNSICIFSH